MSRPGLLFILCGSTVVGLTAASELVVKRDVADDISSPAAFMVGVLLMLEGLLCLRNAVRRIYATQRQAIQFAIVKERMRFARDLHDLLGNNMSAIILKAELAGKIAGNQPARAADEIRGVAAGARQVLAEVRAISYGYAHCSLSNELSLAASPLMAVNVDTQVSSSFGALSQAADSALAAVLREGVTNVIRHSAARNCSITATQEANGAICLRVANDGISDGTRLVHRGGGLDNMAARLSEVHGELTVSLATRNGRQWFELTAAVSVVT
jgi:two-component system sensor histidine kinase DesK